MYNAIMDNNAENYFNQVRRYNEDIKAVISALDPDDTFYYYKGQYVGTLTMSATGGQVKISFQFDEGLRNSWNVDEDV